MTTVMTMSAQVSDLINYYSESQNSTLQGTPKLGNGLGGVVTPSVTTQERNVPANTGRRGPGHVQTLDTAQATQQCLTQILTRTAPTSSSLKRLPDVQTLSHNVGNEDIFLSFSIFLYTQVLH